MTVFDGSTNQTISDKETKVINGLEFVGNGYGKEDSIDKGLPTWNEKNIKNFLYLFSLISQKLNVSDIVDTLSSVDTNKPLSAKQGKALYDLISSLYTKAQIDSLLIQKLNISDIVDNLTSTDTNKPLSAKQGKTLLDLLSSVYTKTETDTRIDTKIASLVGAAPESLNTLKEIADALADDDNQIAALVNSIALKLSISDIVDNTSTTLANKALSANQGKILSDLIAEKVSYSDVTSVVKSSGQFYNKYQIDALLQGYLSSSAALFYRSGSGLGIQVTQLTSKTTAISGNGLCGSIITANTALAAGAYADFTLTNNLVRNTDTVVCTVSSGASIPLNYSLRGFCSTNLIRFRIKNESAGSLSEAVQFTFFVLRAAVN